MPDNIQTSKSGNRRKETYTVQFATRRRELPKPTNGVLSECGYRPDGEGLVPEYLARITSFRNAVTVVGILQEDILTKVESKWEPLVPYSLLAKGNTAVQVLTKSRKSLITKSTSRRMWQGSSPMVLNLKLRFEAIEDPFTDVVEPVRILQSMALPSDSSESFDRSQPSQKLTSLSGLISAGKAYLGGVPVLGPPGPTPFTTEGLLNLKGPTGDFSESTKTIEGLKGGDLIMVELGRLLTFYNVIVSSVTGSHAIKFDQYGDAVSAEVNVVFETYEMMTVESLKDSYRKTVMSIE